MLGVRCHVSGVTYQMSDVRYEVESMLGKNQFVGGKKVEGQKEVEVDNFWICLIIIINLLILSPKVLLMLKFINFLVAYRYGIIDTMRLYIS